MILSNAPSIVDFAGHVLSIYRMYVTEEAFITDYVLLLAGNILLDVAALGPTPTSPPKRDSSTLILVEDLSRLLYSTSASQRL